MPHLPLSGTCPDPILLILRAHQVTLPDGPATGRFEDQRYRANLLLVSSGKVMKVDSHLGAVLIQALR